MINKEFFVDTVEIIDATDDENEALADGLIPDSRIIQIIDELETSNDAFDADEDCEITPQSLELH
jgi:hypothetical protein